MKVRIVKNDKIIHEYTMKDSSDLPRVGESVRVGMIDRPAEVIDVIHDFTLGLKIVKI